MANDKIKRKRYTSPKGEALFAHVIHVDYGTEQYPNKDGAFNIMLALDEDSAEKLRTTLAGEAEEARTFATEKFAALKPAARAKLGDVTFNELGVEEYDKDENLTGRILFRFKTTAFYENRQGIKVQRKVPLFDSMQQPAKLNDEPGNGSLVRVAFTCAPYFVDGQGMGGLTLYLDAVQIIKLTKYGERSADDYGFGAEEGGFCGGEGMHDDADADNASTTGDSSAPSPSSDVGADDVPF